MLVTTLNVVTSIIFWSDHDWILTTSFTNICPIISHVWFHLWQTKVLKSHWENYFLRVLFHLCHCQMTIFLAWRTLSYSVKCGFQWLIFLVQARSLNMVAFVQRNKLKLLQGWVAHFWNYVFKFPDLKHYSLCLAYLWSLSPYEKCSRNVSRWNESGMVYSSQMTVFHWEMCTNPVCPLEKQF